MEWFALLIPLVVSVLVWLRFGKRLVWWELLLPLTLGVVVITVTKWTAEWIQTRDMEYWGGYATRATYYEPWNEKVSCRHPRYRTERYTYPCGSGKSRSTCSGTRQVQVGYQHSYDVDDHPARWEVVDSNHIPVRVSEATFARLCGQFGNKSFREMHRSYYSLDGNAYDTIWNNDPQTLEPVVTKHLYENRVAASDRVLRYPEVSTAERNSHRLFEYPSLSEYCCASVLPSGRWAGEHELDVLNALYGAKHQVRVWLLVFKDAAPNTGKLQEAYWKRGNKNELVITVGVNAQGTLEWSHVFCWCDDQTIKRDTEAFLAAGQSLDVAALAKWLGPEIDAKWKRKQFKDFSRLTVRPTPLAIGILYMLVIASTGGIALWSVTNKFGDSDVAASSGIGHKMRSHTWNEEKPAKAKRKVRTRKRRNVVNTSSATESFGEK